MFNPKNKVFTEKYRPKKVSELVGDFKLKVLKYLENPKALPNFLFYSKTAGTGKSSLSKAIINELGCDSISINSSDDRKIDVVRDRIKQFAMTKSSIEGLKRAVFLDEADGMCLPYGTEIITGSLKNSFIKKIEDVNKEKYVMIPSVNIETGKLEDDKGILVDSGIADFFEIEMEDGRKIIASGNHPFFKKGFKEIKVKELNVGDKIIDMTNDIFKKCPICKTNVFYQKTVCSKKCKNKLHSIHQSASGNSNYGNVASEETRKKISEKIKGCKSTKWQRRLQSMFMKKNNPMKNIEYRKKISKALEGRKITWGDKISNLAKIHEPGTDIYEKRCKRRNKPLSLNHQKKKSYKNIKDTCQICEKVLKTKGDKNSGLILHHLDRNRKNNSNENILYLCSRCHNHIHLGSMKYSNHFDWKEKYKNSIKRLGVIFYNEVCKN